MRIFVRPQPRGIMRRVVTAFVVGLVLACSANQRSDSPERPKALSDSDSAALDDSIKTIVSTYEGGGLTLDEASTQLADLLEPLGGLAYQGKQSPQAQELFRATGRELRRRDARRYGIPDSLPKD
jgi:hypothetical protein